MTAMSRVSLVHTGRSESAVLVRAEMSPSNDRSGDMRCDAAIGLLQMRTDAASAKGQNPITAKSALCEFDHCLILLLRRKSGLTGRSAAEETDGQRRLWAESRISLRAAWRSLG